MRKTRFFLIFSILYMVNTRTERLKLEKNRENFRRYYSNPEKRKRWMKQHLVTRIDADKRCMLRTLRKYGMIEYYIQHTTKDNLEKLKEEQELEPIVLSRPEPYLYENGQISFQSMAEPTPVDEPAPTMIPLPEITENQVQVRVPASNTAQNITLDINENNYNKNIEVTAYDEDDEMLPIQEGFDPLDEDDEYDVDQEMLQEEEVENIVQPTQSVRRSARVRNKPPIIRPLPKKSRKKKKKQQVQVIDDTEQEPEPAPQPGKLSVSQSLKVTQFDAMRSIVKLVDVKVGDTTVKQERLANEPLSVLLDMMKKLTDKMTLPKQFKMSMKDVGSLLNSNQKIFSFKDKSLYSNKARKTLLSRLTSVFREMGCNVGQNILTCFANPRQVFETLRKSFKQWKDYIASIIVLSNISPQFNKALGASRIQAFRDYQRKGIELAEEKQEEQVEEEEVIDYEDILDAYKKEGTRFNKLYKTNVKKNTVKKLTRAEKMFINDYLILSLTILLEPHRDDWNNIKVVSSGKGTVNQNVYNTSNETIYLNKPKKVFKKFKNRPKPTYDLRRNINNLKKPSIPNYKNMIKLGNIITKSLKLWDRKYLVQLVGKEKPYSGLSNRFVQINRRLGLQDLNPLGKNKNIGFNSYRHSRVTQALQDGMSMKERKKLAKQMLHSRSTQSEVYFRKLGAGPGV